MARAKSNRRPGTIVMNKRAGHDYLLEDRFEAGLGLHGWEVKSLRAGKAQLVDSYVLIRDGEAWLLGAHISPLPSASTHVATDPTRTRKLLLHKKEISRIFSATQQKGYTCIATAMYWKGHRVKIEVALGKGKKQFDKRRAEKERDWGREKQRLFKNTA